MRGLTIGVVVVLALAFVLVEAKRVVSTHQLAQQTTVLAAAPPVVVTAEVKPAAESQGLTLPGETHAWYASTIYSRVSGYVARWNVDIGDHVTSGQILAEIDTPELDAELTAAKAKLRVSQADVKVKEAEAEFARTTYVRWRDAAPGVVSEQEREDKKAGFDSANARLLAAQAQAELDQANVDRISAFEQFKHVAAPYSGTITERDIDIGNLVSAGSSGGTTPLYRMAKDDPMRVWADVPQSAGADLMKPGVAAHIVTEQTPVRTFEGKIIRTTQAVDPQTRTFRVEIDVPNSNRDLVSGMYVQVSFALPSQGFLSVPAAALVFRGTEPQVAVVDKTGTINMRSVTIARDDGSTVLLSSGVTTGEKVVLNLSNQLTEGEKVVAHDGEDETGPSGAMARLTKRP